MQQAYITVDLGFGDAGKGSVVDFLTRAHDAHTVVRFNGGAQAGHRVVTAGPEPQEHVFAQFGSGTLAGAATHLSRFMLVDPLAMVPEAEHLAALGCGDPFARTTVDEHAPIVTPFQRATNRLRELARGAGRHGSCGMGIGETMIDVLEHGSRVLFAGDLRDERTMRTKLRFLRETNLAKVRPLFPALPDNAAVADELAMLTDSAEEDWIVEAYQELATRLQIVPGDYLHSVLRRPGTVVFEAAQGVLLDEWHGFHPYTTWSTTTADNAHQLLQEADYSGQVRRIGITRAYTTRHGAGPFVTEDAALTQALPDACNGFGVWQQGFRVGWLDLVMLRYALDVTGGVDELAVTCLDRVAALPTLNVCRAYQDGDRMLERIVPSPIPRSLDYQAELARDLVRYRPMLEAVPTTDALLDIMAADLGVQIGLLSWGPSAADKMIPVAAPLSGD